MAVSSLLRNDWAIEVRGNRFTDERGDSDRPGAIGAQGIEPQPNPSRLTSAALRATSRRHELPVVLIKNP
jgi:hypothetical protein